MEQQGTSYGESRNRSREIDRAYLKCTEAEAHRNYRESVSEISRALARHESVGLVD